MSHIHVNIKIINIKTSLHVSPEKINAQHLISQENFRRIPVRKLNPQQHH